MPHPYLRLLADRRLRRLAAGDLLSCVGDGMAVVAIPWEALHLAHLEGVGKGLAVSAAASAYALVGVPLALASGLGRYRPDPRWVLLADCALRAGVFVLIGVLAATGHLGLQPALRRDASGQHRRGRRRSGHRLRRKRLGAPDGQHPLHPDGVLALLQVSRRIDDQHRVRITEVLNKVVPDVVADGILIPDRPGKQVLHAIRAVVPCVLGQAPAGLSAQVGQRPAHERAGAPAGFDSGEPAGDAAEQFVEE